MYPKLRTYKLFKQEYKLENYLLQLKDLRYIKVLITFRISSHSLRIETDRYERETAMWQNSKTSCQQKSM